MGRPHPSTVTALYLASTQPASGTSAIAVGLLDQLRRRAGRVAVYRPIVRSREHDPLSEVLASMLPGEQGGVTIGVTYDEAHVADHAMGTIVAGFHRAAADAETVLVVGSDFTDVATATELAANATAAANLGAPMLLVVPADGRTPTEVAAAAEIAARECRDRHARVLGVVVNRADDHGHAEIRAAVAAVLPGVGIHLVPDEPVLRAPTMRDVLGACGGRLVRGDEELLDREALGVVVAAMTMPHVLDRLIEGGVVVVPSDREAILLAVLVAHRSATFPNLSGIVLNGGFALSPQVERLLDGIGVTLPVISTPSGTMATATALLGAQGRIGTRTLRKIEAATTLVDRSIDTDALLDELAPVGREVVTPLMFEHTLLRRAREAGATIVLPEGLEDRVLTAAGRLLDRGTARLVLLGPPEEVRARAAALDVDLRDSRIIDPRTDPLRERFAEAYAALRAHKGVTLDAAHDIVSDPSYFGTLLVQEGLADGMVSGSITTTAATIRPALEVIRTSPGVSIVSSVFLMCLADQVLVYGDCAVNPDPTAEQLADIAISSARTAEQFGIEPRVAMLSYSTGASGSGADVEKVRAATALVRERAPELLVEGPIQYDAAVDPAVAATKLGDSPVAGRATVLVFPDLNTGNNTYKAVQRTAGAVAIGPVLQGLRKPVNDLSRGALVADIVNTVAITAIQVGESR